MATLKPEYLKSKTIKVRFNSVGKFYPVSREKLCTLKDEGKLGKEFDCMFLPDAQVKAAKAVETKAKVEAAAKAKAEAEAAAKAK